MRLYPGKTVELASAYSVKDSVKRLSTWVKADNAENRLQGGFLGSVSPGKVIIYYFDPLARSSGGVRFEGSLAEKSGSAVLTGTFKTPKGLRIFFNVLLAVAALFLCYSIIDSGFLFAPVLLLLMWIVLVLVSWWLGRRDIAYISDAVTAALRRD